MKTIVDLIEPHIEGLKREGRRNSYIGPCPFCEGGQDRFAVFPAGNQETYPGNYWCRQCGAEGDAYDFCKIILGMTSHRDIQRVLERRASDSDFTFQMPTVKVKKTNQSKSERADSDKWRQVAERCTEYYHSQLLKSPDVLTWLETERGINKETAIQFKLGYNPKDVYTAPDYWGLTGTKKAYLAEGLVIPHISPDKGITGVKVRTWKDSDSIKPNRPAIASYVAVRGTETKFFLPAELVPHKPVVLVESELDALLLWQEIGACYTPLALLTANAKPTIGFELPPFFALDDDDTGQSAYEWWGQKHGAFHIPLGGGDITDFWRGGGCLWELISEAKPYDS